MPYDVLIIGGGIVGLATALQLKVTKPDLKVVLLEKENELAKHQTSNNSGVIHSGIYYKPGSLKATNCINGYKMLLDFCNNEGINYELCGKIIVATREDELIPLENLYQRGLQNGLLEIKKITKEDIRNYEPYATGIAGIWVPYTGIIDFKDVCSRYAEKFTNQYEGVIHLNEKVENIQLMSEYAEVYTKNQTFKAKVVVNTAGLYSDKIALMTRENIDVRIIPFRGEYFEVKKEKHHWFGI